MRMCIQTRCFEAIRSIPSRYADAMVAPARVRRYHPYAMPWLRSSQWSRAAEYDQRGKGTCWKRKHVDIDASEDDVSWSRSSHWSGAAEHDQRNEGSDWKRKLPGTDASEDYELKRGDRLRRTLAEAWRTTSSDEQRFDRRLDSEIKLFKLNDIDPNYKDNHIRIPDLSADIKSKFPTEEYNGAYVSHGQSKSVFAIRSSGRKAGRFDGAVLKISQEYDTEP